MHKYLIIVDRANWKYPAYSLGLPGCIARVEAREEGKAAISQVIEMYLRCLSQDYQAIPEPHGVPGVRSKGKYRAVQKHCEAPYHRVYSANLHCERTAVMLFLASVVDTPPEVPIGSHPFDHSATTS